jgi:hypothetical protein
MRLTVTAPLEGRRGEVAGSTFFVKMMLEFGLVGGPPYTASLRRDREYSRQPPSRNTPMPLFYFNLHDAKRLIADLEGTELPDENAARDHAAVVAREIMRNNSARTLAWRLRVADAEHRHRFDLLFASIAPDLEQYTPEFRQLVERKSHNIATLADSVLEVRHSLRQMRAMLARADRVPYLAYVNGRRVEGTG